MTTQDCLEQALSLVISAQDAVEDLKTATVLINALEQEIGGLVEVIPADPRAVCERASYLLGLYHDEALASALAKILHALEEARYILLVRQEVRNEG